jgi:hypothetical protein
MFEQLDLMDTLFIGKFSDIPFKGHEFADFLLNFSKIADFPIPPAAPCYASDQALAIMLQELHAPATMLQQPGSSDQAPATRLQVFHAPASLPPSTRRAPGRPQKYRIRDGQMFEMWRDCTRAYDVS